MLDKKNIPFNVPVEEAKQLLLQAVTCLGTDTIDLENALGRVLTHDVYAKENIPSFDRSPLDGYVVRSTDLEHASHDHPVTLPIQEETPAGYVAKEPLKPGFAIKLTTGAPIPEGADAVIKYEDTEFTPEQVTFFAPVKANSNIVLAGSDVKLGQLMMAKGKVLDPADLGILASLGYAKLDVYRKPRITLISTGDELVAVDQPLEPGKIRNSSAYLLKGILEKCGFTVKLAGIVKDTMKETMSAVESAFSEADVVMTTGGVSVGDYDYIPDAMEEMGASLLFWKTKLKPGMATVASVKNGKLLVGLSGNPSAAAAGLYVAVLPALYKMAGRKSVDPEEMEVTFLEGFKKKSPGGRVLPGKLMIWGGKACISIRPRQENGMISNWGDCNLLAMVEKGRGPIEAGETCRALYIGQ